MSQHDYNIANQGFPAFRSDLNNALSAIQTTNSGTSRPSGAVAGQLWLDTTTATSPTLKYYDGADDISLAIIDHTANTVNWLDSTVSITGLSTTATGTVLTLSDTANTTTVNLIIDNQKEIRFREATANGTNYVSLSAPASLSADLTFTLPATDGTNGQVLSTNGSGVLSFITPSSGISWQSTVKTSDFTATAGEGYFCNTTSSAITVTLPSTPTAGQQVAVVDYAGTFDTNPLTISPNGNKLEGATSSLQLKGEREGILLVYIDSTQGWLATSGINEGTDALEPLIPIVDFLIVAGGGGGGGGNPPHGGGGGGAGGYRSFTTQTLSAGTNYTVTVGAGGAGGTYSSGAPAGTNGTTGSNSVFSTYTSAGGGGGARGESGSNVSGLTGGSGGGATRLGTGGAGNTPSTSPSQGNAGGNAGYAGGDVQSGGGGGSSAVGQNPPNSTTSGAGGAGTANSITGSSVTYAGGGGGGGSPPNGVNAGAGGSGGGGAGGALPSSAGTAGTANLGGGGGGSSNASTSFSGGAGGSGVVIIKYSNLFTISNSGGGLTFSTATSGSDKITTFTAGTGNIQFN